jgi:hypothetical protein
MVEYGGMPRLLSTNQKVRCSNHLGRTTLKYLISNSWGRNCGTAQITRLAGMPRSMPTIRHMRAVHGGANRLLVGVNVSAL